MESTFRGRFESKLDQKGRLLIPSAYRVHSQSSIVITNSQYQGQRCLDVYSLKAWERLEKKIARMSQLKIEVQSFQRFYLASGQVVELDAHNRILIPQGLRAYAGLETTAQLVGMGQKFEIWSELEWSKLYQGLAENFEQTLSAIAELDDGETE
jgi:MraZ protein